MNQHRTVYICLGHSIGYNDQEHYFEEGFEVPDGAHEKYKDAAMEVVHNNTELSGYLYDMYVDLEEPMIDLCNFLTKTWDLEEMGVETNPWGSGNYFTETFLDKLSDCPLVLDLFLQAADISPCFVKEIKILNN